jgi:hypothetical protein
MDVPKAKVAINAVFEKVLIAATYIDKAAYWMPPTAQYYVK